MVAQFLSLAGFHLGCDSEKAPTFPRPPGFVKLELQDVQTLIAQTVEQAERLNEKVVIAVTDREGNILGVFRMTGSTGSVENPVIGAVVKARTVSYLSSSQFSITTLTACFITRTHFPPGINNTPAGPLFSVVYSQLGGAKIQPNGSLVLGGPGLTGAPGGVSIYKNGALAGGLGVSGGSNTQELVDGLLDRCAGVFKDEIIALGGTLGYQAPLEKRADQIFVEGIRLLYQNGPTPEGNFQLKFQDLASRGVVVPGFPIRESLPPLYPQETGGPIDLSSRYGPAFNFRVKDGRGLAASEVQRIIDQAVAQAAKTRAAVRRPLGVPAQVFISVVDMDGTILAIWLTPDALFDALDVTPQKARTSLAFSDPNQPFGKRIREILGLASNAGLAMSTRAIGFLGQRFYPPGIDVETLNRPVRPGPLFIDPVLKGLNPFFDFALQDSLSRLPNLPPYGNGISIFPGGLPLYKNGQLVGGIGVSGDGVEQNDLIAFAGAQGFEPPPEIRSDQFKYRDIRLPYVKFPRQPEIR
jgi:uncharacterized protein GlcG (DUF336 family)